jgi:hypothetical protein
MIIPKKLEANLWIFTLKEGEDKPGYGKKSTSWSGMRSVGSDVNETTVIKKKVLKVFRKFKHSYLQK